MDQEQIKQDAEYFFMMTPEQRRDLYAAQGGSLPQANYESGRFSDEAVKKSAYAPRYEAAKEYFDSLS